MGGGARRVSPLDRFLYFSGGSREVGVTKDADMTYLLAKGGGRWYNSYSFFFLSLFFLFLPHITSTKCSFFLPDGSGHVTRAANTS